MIYFHRFVLYTIGSRRPTPLEFNIIAHLQIFEDVIYGKLCVLIYIQLRMNYVNVIILLVFREKIINNTVFSVLWISIFFFIVRAVPTSWIISDIWITYALVISMRYQSSISIVSRLPRKFQKDIHLKMHFLLNDASFFVCVELPVCYLKYSLYDRNTFINLSASRLYNGDNNLKRVIKSAFFDQ